MTRRSRLLLVGPLPIEGDVIGGTKVSFAGLVEAVTALGAFEVEVLNTSRVRAGRGPLRRRLDDALGLSRLVARLLFGRGGAVVLNVSSGGLLSSGPLAWVACRLRRRPLAVRVFGGDLDLFLDAAPAPLAAVARRTFLRADQVWLQTASLVRRFGDGSGRVRQWPTTRDLDARKDAPTGARRFLFLGQLRAEKGVREALVAAADLPRGATLTVQGPPMPGCEIEAREVPSQAELRPPVPREEVASVLADHDVLVFPTYHTGEGLPGILIEAMQIGLPVVATDWRGVPELVEDDVNGLLVAPRDAAELGAAMRRIALDDELFQRLREGALARGERYRTRRWSNTLRDWLTALNGAPAKDPRPLAAQPVDGEDRAPGQGVSTLR